MIECISFLQLVLNYFIMKKITVIVICVSRPKSASFSSEAEFSGRGAAEA
jgi:hypothetical protein